MPNHNDKVIETILQELNNIYPDANESNEYAAKKIARKLEILYKTMDRECREAHEYLAKRVEAKTPCGTMFVIGNYLKSNPNDLIQTHIYLNRSYKRAPCLKCNLEAISRLSSLCLKYNVPFNKIVNELYNLRCNYEKADIGNKNVSCPHAFANAMKRLRHYNGD